MSKLKIGMFVCDGDSSRIIFNKLKDKYNIEFVIMEESISKKKLILNRIKKLGLLKVLGQLSFMIFFKLLKKISKTRIQNILKVNECSILPIQHNNLIYVNSINNEEVLNRLQDFDFDIIIVNGTRIISNKILKNIKVPIINTHVGITPKYRGVHGGYWSLVNNDSKNCGVTVHLVDSGIDTGNILYQDIITNNLTKEDNFATYSYLQTVKAIPLLENVLKDLENDKIRPIQTKKKYSKLYYHPTLIEYIINYIQLKVK